jgi:hypothetical protein
LVGFTDIYGQITMNMTTRTLVSGFALGGATLAMAFGSIDRAQAIVLVNDDFGTGTTGAYNITPGTLDSSFTITSGSVDLIGGVSTNDFYPGNGNYIDLNGLNPGTIASSIFNFNAGDVVTLSFDYGANGSNRSADISLGSFNFSPLTGVNQGAQFQSFTQTFTVSSAFSGALNFTASNPGTGGVVLDNIVLSSTPVNEVPEPSDLMGTAVAFGSVVLLKRNLSKKRNASK